MLAFFSVQEIEVQAVLDLLRFLVPVFAGSLGGVLICVAQQSVGTITV